MKKMILIMFFLGIIALLFFSIIKYSDRDKTTTAISSGSNPAYWFVLYRKSGKEFLYYGTPGVKKDSSLIKVFIVKSGIPNERPTPLPGLLGRVYWLIISKEPQIDNPETAPYFLTLDVPVGSEEPFGPAPYEECDGLQCNWALPGAFGLHGVNGDESRLSPENPGSSGCIRHRDEDITYLYNLLEPDKEEIRYYVLDL